MLCVSYSPNTQYTPASGAFAGRQIFVATPPPSSHPFHKPHSPPYSLPKSTKKTYLTNLSPLASTFKSITPASYAIIFIETNMYTF